MASRPLVMRVHFYLPDGQGRKSLQSAAHHAAYIVDPEKHELLVGRDAAAHHEAAAHHVAYASGAEGHEGVIAAFGHPPDPHAAERDILRARGPVWRVIVSMPEEDAAAMGGALFTRAGWEAATRPMVERITKELHLDPAKVRWFAAAHRDQAGGEHNPHVHLLLWEAGAPTRRVGQWTDRERRAVRQAWTQILYAPEWAALGQTKTQARQALRERLQVLVGGQDPEARQGDLQALADRLAALGRQLPAHGRLAYAYQPPAVKEAVTGLARWVLDHDPALRAARDRFLTAHEAIARAYQQDPTPARAQAEQDLLQRMAGPLLRAAAQAGAPEREAARRAAWQAERAALDWQDPALREAVRRVRAGADPVAVARATAYGPWGEARQRALLGPLRLPADREPPRPGAWTPWRGSVWDRTRPPGPLAFPFPPSSPRDPDPARHRWEREVRREAGFLRAEARRAERAGARAARAQARQAAFALRQALRRLLDTGERAAKRAAWLAEEEAWRRQQAERALAANAGGLYLG